MTQEHAPYPYAPYPYAEYGQDHYRDDTDDDLYPPPPPKRGVNPLAVVALVFGLLGGLLVSVLCGLVALRQIKRTGQKGRGVALAGLAASGFWAVCAAVAILDAVLWAQAG